MNLYFNYMHIWYIYGRARKKKQTNETLMLYNNSNSHVVFFSSFILMVQLEHAGHAARY